METTLQWGLDFIRLVQTYANPQLTVFMRVITNLGSVPTYMIALPFIFWCVDEKKGMRFGAAVLISAWINIALKFLLKQPRPFFAGYDPSVGMINEKLGGFPSGHAQNLAVMLFIIASWLKRKQGYVIAALLCLLIGFSRIYLGVHFPTDVLGGWVLSALVLCGYFTLGNKIEALLAKGGFRAGLYASAGLSFLMILYLPGEEILMPGGTLLGMGVGYCLNCRYIGFTSALADREGTAKHLAFLVRYLLGITGVLLIYILIGKLITQNSGNRNLFVFTRFALLGLWVSAGAPWIYVKLHLASKQKE
jgi:membrane-associated phospholipid phosphatase